MTITLHAAPTSNCRRVVLVMHELGLPYTLRLVDRAAGMQHEPGFRAVNPSGMVPVIIDTQGPFDAKGCPIPVAQSGAILIHLAEKAGRLLPESGERRVAALQWLMHVLTDVNATVSALFHALRVSAVDSDPVVLMLETRLQTYLRDCCWPLRSCDYLAGELSLADFALYPLVESNGSFIRARPDLSLLLAWQHRMGRLPSVRYGMQVLP